MKNDQKINGTRSKNSADVLAGMSALGWHTAAQLARMVGVSGTNMSAFIAWRKPKAVNGAAIAEALKLCGFVSIGDQLDFTRQGFGCPVIHLTQLTSADESVVRHMFRVLNQSGFQLSVNQLINEAVPLTGEVGLTQSRAYVLTLHKPNLLTECWSAFVLEPTSSDGRSINLLKEMQNGRGLGGGKIRVSRRLWQAWISSGPRFDEIQDVIETSDIWTDMVRSIQASKTHELLTIELSTSVRRKSYND